MTTLKLEDFQAWLAAYGQASADNDPQASAALFSVDAEYHETPFAPPLIGQEAIYQHWDQGARNLTDKTSTYEILAIHGNRGLARWQSTFVHVVSGERIALDCVFLVKFDKQRKCRVFREWWHHQVVATAPLTDGITQVTG